MPPTQTESESLPGQEVAIAAQSLYLVNLLLVPGVAFLALLWLYRRFIGTTSAFAADHLRQALRGSLWAGALLIVVNVLIVTFGGYRAASTWVIAVIYFTCCHAALVMFGIVGLARAMAGRPYRYPLIGAPLAQEGPA